MRILFISATRLGDAVISTGILDHLIRTYPHAKVVVACGPVAEGVFARMPNRAWTIVLAKRPFRLHWWELWRQVGGRPWDLVVDLRGSAFAFTLRARRRLVFRGGRQAGPRVRQLGALLGLDPPPLPVAWFGPAETSRAATLLPGEGPWILLGPTANWAGKVWPADRFVALYQALAAPDGPLPGARVAVLGGPGREERAMAAPVLAALQAAAGRAAALAGATMANGGEGSGPAPGGEAACGGAASGATAGDEAATGTATGAEGAGVAVEPVRPWPGNPMPGRPMPGSTPANPAAKDRLARSEPPKDGQVVDLVGSLSVPEVAAVLARGAIFIGNDSGLMHLAAAAGAPTLGLFGPSRVAEYAPAGRRAGFVVAPGSPAPGSMQGLTVASALEGARRLLAG